VQHLRHIAVRVVPVRFVQRTHGRARQPIVAEVFAARGADQAIARIVGVVSVCRDDLIAEIDGLLRRIL